MEVSVKAKSLGGPGGATSARPSRVLVVDDEVVIQALLTEVLSEEGHEITTADGGQRAIDLLASDRFDLVICDVMMPEVNGIAVLSAARRIDPECPVLMITGYPSAETIERLINLGAADYITKPFNVDLIKLTVAKNLERKQSERAALQVGPTTQLPTLDAATGMYNLALFKQAFEGEIGRSERRGHICSLLMAEIDDFDEYAFGRDTSTADEHLRMLGRLLWGESGPGDIIGRTGRAEFALVLPETGPDEAYALGHRVQMKAEWQFTTSIGVACFPKDGGKPGGLIDAARAGVRANNEARGPQLPPHQ